MKVKYKFLVGMLVITMLILGSGITYSIFNSGAGLVGSQEIAQFIFNTEQVDHIEVPLIDMNPGSSREYAFAVSNNTSDTKRSNVTVEYEITIKTYHLIPLEIKLKKVDLEGKENDIMTCDETTQNTINEYVCVSPIQLMSHTVSSLDNYILELVFPTTDGMDSEIYANLVDYISLDITSWQKMSSE